MLSNSTWPMPPAPIRPSTVADRLLDSKRYRANDVHSGATCGSTPQTISCSLPAPVARTPSTGPLSMDSTASENSLARTPAVFRVIARTPASGPRPTAVTNSRPITRSGTERSRFITQRTGVTIQTGAMLRAAARPRGMPSRTARKVPHRAIWTVSHILATNIFQSAKSGRIRSWTNSLVLSLPANRREMLPRSTASML